MVKKEDELSATKKLMVKVYVGKATAEERDILKKIRESLKERDPKKAEELEKFGEQIGKGIAKGMQEISKTSEKPKVERESITSYRRPVFGEKWEEAMKQGSPIGFSEKKEEVHVKQQEQPKAQSSSLTQKQEKKPEKSIEKQELELMEELKAKVGKGEMSRTDMGKELESFRHTQEREKELREKIKEENPTSIWGKAKKTFGAAEDTYGKAKNFGMKIQNFSIPGLGNVGKQILSPFESAMWSGIFGLCLSALIWFSTKFTIPMVEGYTGNPVLSPSANLYVLPFLSNPLYLVIMTLLITGPLSVVGGFTRWNLKGPCKFCFYLLAAEATLIGLNTWGVSATEHYFPEQAAFFKCMIKYSGNVQICALNQTQEVQVDKQDDLYETITLEIGAVTPSRIIPPMNPKPDSTTTYYFPFTLKNNNRVGSPYEINVTKESDYGIIVEASDEQSGETHFKIAKDIISYPTQPISPGGYVITQAKFNGLDNILCTDSLQYTYFHINVTTEQSGGGSTKLGIIDSNEGIDNRNFMYFFDPDVKTETGPLDVYTYTLPFVLPVNELRSPPSGSVANQFQVYITIENKGNGIAYLKKGLNFIFNPDVLRKNSPMDGCYQYCNSLTMSCPDPNSSTVKDGNIKFLDQELILSSGEIYTIICDAYLPNTSFVGKSTNIISVVTNYDYKQTFDEQIACIHKSDADIQLECVKSCIDVKDESDESIYETGKCLCPNNPEQGWVSIGKDGCTGELCGSQYMGQYSIPVYITCYCKPKSS